MNTRYQEAVAFFNQGNIDSAENLLLSLENENEHPDTQFFLAVIKSKKGDLNSAIMLYQKALRNNPNHLEANYNIALCYQNTGKENDALKYYEKALEINPFLSEAHNNMAIIYKKLNHFDKAEQHYNLALKSRPDCEKVIKNLAGLKNNRFEIHELQKVHELFEAGNYDSAEALLNKVKEQYPENLEVLNALGTFYFHIEQLKKAIQIFENIIEKAPENETAHYSLGVCYQNLEESNPALKHYQKCLDINPSNLDALNNLGLLYSSIKNYSDAEKCFRTAISLDASYFNAFTNLGSLLINQDKLDEANDCFLKALELADSENNISNKSVAFANLGFIKLRKKMLDEAIEYFNKAIALNPESILAHYNKAETLFMTGKLEQAWKHYEYRTGRKDFGKRHFHKRPSDLSAVKGKRILVYAEQGLGDAFQFIRYLPLLKKEDCYVIFECDKSIFGLLKNFAGIDELLERNLLEAPKINYDLEIPLLSLPLLFNTCLNTIPSDVPYLFADELDKSKWEKITGESEKVLKIGIVWAGNPIHSNDRHRSVRLNQFMNLFSIEGTRFFSLQKGFPLIQAKDYHLLLTNLDDYGISSFSDTAGILANLELLITVDTSVAHLSGAMGIPTWILLPNLPDWRWMLDRDDSPWYPSVRLFRQPALGNWGSVFSILKSEILKLVQNKIGNKMNRDYKHLNKFLNKVDTEVYAEAISPLHQQLTQMTFDKLLGKYIKGKDLKILDIGCGKGPALELFRKNGLNAVGITLSDEDVNDCRSKGFDVHKMDQSFMNFEDETFDFVWARHVLEHSIMPLFTLSEYYRVTKQNGIIYIEVPGADTDARHSENPNHYSIFGRSSWIALINKSGFELMEEFPSKLLMQQGGKDEYYGFLCRKQKSEIANKKLFLGLSSGENFGWGVCSKYLKKHLAGKANIINLDENPDIVNKGTVEGSIFHALTGDFISLFPVRGNKNYGYTFFEYELSEDALRNAQQYDLIIGGSTWNEKKLKEKGINNSSALIQGIDPDLFYPGEKMRNNDLFVIFSGGKFELRKGQDLVLKAFQLMHQKYPDMILLNAWYNMWPETVKSMSQSKHINFDYKGDTWKNFMINLCQINGIDGNRVFTLPITPNKKLREIYLNSDIGLFPNRCEGGTNLVLMEYMACGKPVIASYNSGHKDILTESNSLLLNSMHEFRLYDNSNKTIADWEEPDLEEIIDRIEFAYHNRTEIKNIGRNAGVHLKKFTWENAAVNLLNIIKE